MNPALPVTSTGALSHSDMDSVGPEPLGHELLQVLFAGPLEVDHVGRLLGFLDYPRIRDRAVVGGAIVDVNQMSFGARYEDVALELLQHHPGAEARDLSPQRRAPGFLIAPPHLLVVGPCLED